MSGRWEAQYAHLGQYGKLTLDDTRKEATKAKVHDLRLHALRSHFASVVKLTPKKGSR